LGSVTSWFDLSGRACRGISLGFRRGDEEGDFIKPAVRAPSASVALLPSVRRQKCVLVIADRSRTAHGARGFIIKLFDQQFEFGKAHFA
jgi:hypothetical protein